MIKLDSIYKENCVDFMKILGAEGITVDVIVTSPPYNINKEYGTYKDKRERTEYLEWLHEVARLSYLILKDEGSLFFNIGGTHSDPTLAFDVVREFKVAGYNLQNTIHWIKSISIEKEDLGKSNGMRDACSVGHFKPIISERFLTDLQEYIFHLTKGGNLKVNKRAIGVPYQDKTNIGRWKSAIEDKRDRGNVWFIPYSTINESRPHPAIFPEKLPYLCIKMHGIKKGMVVYDPFIGVGTTALACIRLGVGYLGTEIDGEYRRLAIENIERKKREKRCRLFS